MEYVETDNWGEAPVFPMEELVAAFISGEVANYLKREVANCLKQDRWWSVFCGRRRPRRSKCWRISGRP